MADLFPFPMTKIHTALDKESNFFKKTAQMGKSWDMMCMNMYISPSNIYSHLDAGSKLDALRWGMRTLARYASRVRS